MSADWETRALGELLELVIDHRGKTPNKMGFDDFHGFGHPVLSAKHVKTDELVNLDAMRFANEEMYKKWMKVEVQDGDIALTSEAPMGEVFYLDGSVKYVFGQRVFGLRPKKSLINPLFLTAWLTSETGQNQLKARASGSTVLGIKQSELLKIEVDVPPLKTQGEIAKIRYDLSKKIALNRQINQTLEQMAQAIFKSWFVDFDLVRAKMEGRDTGLLLHIADLFPDELVESELGLIPKGWGGRRVDEILDLPYGKALGKTVRIEGKIPVYGSGGITGFHNAALVKGPGIIVGRKGTVGSLYWEDADFFPIDTVFYVEPKPSFNLEYIFYMLQTLGLEGMNTDAAVPGLNRNNVYRLMVAGVPLNLVKAFKDIVWPIREKISACNREIHSLIDIRDSLLPKLLSGEIEVGEVA